MSVWRLITLSGSLSIPGTYEIEDPVCSAAMSMRMLIATWLSEAWADLRTNHDANIIESAFVKTRYKLAKDGSEDDKIGL